jgi:DNA-binding response OmpR family regulator
MTSVTRVLVVEDEFWLADDVSKALSRAGCEVVGPFATVGAAFLRLESASLDAAILDINLRGEDVFPLASELRRRGIPYAFTTGYGKEVLPPEHRAVPRWQKPFDAAQMVRGFLLRTVEA